MKKETRASKTRDRVFHVLIGALGLSWLYHCFVYYQRYPTVSDFFGMLNLLVLCLGALAVLIAVHYFTSNNAVTRGWLWALWVVGSLAFNVLRAIYEGQKDDAGKWILLGTLGIMVITAILYLLLRRLPWKKRSSSPETPP